MSEDANLLHPPHIVVNMKMRFVDKSWLAQMDRLRIHQCCPPNPAHPLDRSARNHTTGRADELNFARGASRDVFKPREAKRNQRHSRSCRKRRSRGAMKPE